MTTRLSKRKQEHTVKIIEPWGGVRRLLAAYEGTPDGVVGIDPALQLIRSALPAISVSLLASSAACRASRPLKQLEERIRRTDGRGMLSSTESFTWLADSLRKRGFEVMVIFTEPGYSPYFPAYVGYLAGIPIRIGLSEEFGGEVLTHRFDPPVGEPEVDPHLYLLEKSGLRAEQFAISNE